MIAASSDRDANRTAGERARSLGIPVSVADAKGESTFFFPAVIEGGGIVAGLISEGQDHRLAARRAAEIREMLGKGAQFVKCIVFCLGEIVRRS